MTDILLKHSDRLLTCARRDVRILPPTDCKAMGVWFSFAKPVKYAHRNKLGDNFDNVKSKLENTFDNVKTNFRHSISYDINYYNLSKTVVFKVALM